MKKRLYLLALAALLIGCTQPASPGTEPAQTETTEEAEVIPTEEAEEEPVVTEVKVIRAVDIYQPGGILVVTLDPEHPSLAVLSNEYTKEVQLQPGDVLAVTHAGIFLQTYPLQFGSVQEVERVRHEPDQAGLVTGVFDEFAEDAALASGISKMGVDLSEAENLTEGEKRAVLWHVQSGRDVTLIEATFDELAEQGEINTEEYYWEDGMFFSFSARVHNEDKSELTYDARLWHSGTGAAGSEDVNAVWEDGTWHKDGGSHYISTH